MKGKCWEFLLFQAFCRNSCYLVTNRIPPPCSSSYLQGFNLLITFFGKSCGHLPSEYSESACLQHEAVASSNSHILFGACLIPNVGERKEHTFPFLTCVWHWQKESLYFIRVSLPFSSTLHLDRASLYFYANALYPRDSENSFSEN